MMKKFSLIAIAIGILLVLVSPVLTQAQGGLTVLNSSTQIQFPTQLQFSLSASSDSNITDIRLRYTTGRESFARVTSEGSVVFVPSTNVNVFWSLDMVRVGGLPPGTNIDYWWLIKDARGNQLETQPTRVQFNDTRYPWLSKTEGQVTLWWYAGDQAFADELMSAVQSSLSMIARDTGATLEKPVNIYIYASQQDLLGAMINPQEWTGGVTYVGFNVIVIGISTTQLEWGKGAIAHELTHEVIGEITRNPYSGLPTWLNEGLAVYGQGNGGADFNAYLNAAIANKTLISVRSLCSPFSAVPELAFLSYGESYSIVNYLISQYGQAKMLQLLNTFKQGNTYDGALKAVYGFDIDGLNTQWQNYVFSTATTGPLPLPVQ